MNFENFLVDFLDYLKKSEGFSVSGDALTFIFSAIHDSSIDITSEDETMNVIRSAVCKTPDQYNNFPEIFSNYYKSKKKHSDKINKAKNRADTLKSKLEKIQEKERENKKSNTAEEHNHTFDGIEKRDAFLRKIEKHKTSVKKVISSGGLSKETKALANLLFFNKQCKPFSDDLTLQILRELQDFVKSAGFKAAMTGEKPVIDILKTAKSEIKKAKENIENKLHRVQSGVSESEQVQKQLNQALKELENLQHTQIFKPESLNHRPTYTNGRNSIKSYSKGEAIFNKCLADVSCDDMKTLQYYVRKNAARFKTKIAKNVSTSNKVRYDIKNIIKKACSSGGIPMKLMFKKPMQNKPKLVLVLDISGSCSSASKLMLLFMYYLKQAFAGGCNAYVFVNSLHDVTSFLNTKSPLQAVNSIMESIPTRGVYSDYNVPLKYFYENNMGTINKDSIVVFIGDARNNSNPTGEEYIKAISRKSRACFWLNTEDEAEWNTGDSIMSCYAKYMQDVLPVLTVGQLIDFITNFKIRKGVFYA